jgi:hypothetical protein
VEDDQELMAALESCDQRYYAIGDIDEKLFAFVQANAGLIQVCVAKTSSGPDER